MVERYLLYKLDIRSCSKESYKDANYRKLSGISLFGAAGSWRSEKFDAFGEDPKFRYTVVHVGGDNAR